MFYSNRKLYCQLIFLQETSNPYSARLQEFRLSLAQHSCTSDIDWLIKLCEQQNWDHPCRDLGFFTQKVSNYDYEYLRLFCRQWVREFSRHICIHLRTYVTMRCMFIYGQLGSGSPKAKYIFYNIVKVLRLRIFLGNNKCRVRVRQSKLFQQ